MTHDQRTSPEPPDADGAPAPDESLRERVRGLAQRIIHLADEDIEDVEVEDPEVSQRLAMSVKPYIDRLVALRRLMNPVGRIVNKRHQITELQEEIAEDIASVENASDELEDGVDPELMTELQTELAAVKRDRRLFNDEDDGPAPDTDDSDAPDAVEAATDSGGGGRLPLLRRRVAERLRLLLGPRFLDLDQLAEVLCQPLPEDETAKATVRLERVWDGLMAIDRFRTHARENHVPALRRALQDYVLVYRSASLPGADGTTVPCSIDSLKDLFGARFVSASDRSLWYSRLPFYRDPLLEGHWALLDGQYLNCTFKQPKIRLVMYARANDLPAAAVRQKSVLEDVYDRVVVDTALRQLFFHNCNSLTRTTYQQKDEQAKKLVHVYYRDAQIRISGKRGVPHWRPSKPRWPGVIPAVVFDQRERG